MAGSQIKKTVLELGGSNAFIVLEDAELDKAVDIGVSARMQNAGQSCIAAKRFILHKKISDDFINLFNEKIKSLILGNPLEASTDMGPLSSIGQADIVKNQVMKSIKSGAKILSGGFPVNAVYPPTILLNVKPGVPAFDEEIFGPVAPVIVCNNADEAIKLSNQSKFGLGVSLFTNDLEKAERLVPEFEDGAVFINALVKSDPRLPFGGTKHSGYGRELAINGIREFVNVKTVYFDKFHDEKKKDAKNIVISMGNQT
jgi:succinate-semialdehyde dehydrogenase/glutarate-semialdehyde dehydrogenase